MKLPKLPRSRSANSSPLSSPRAQDVSTSSPSVSALSSPKPCNKSSSSSSSSLQLCLPALSRSRSRSKREFISDSRPDPTSPVPHAAPPSPLGKSNLQNKSSAMQAAQSFRMQNAALARNAGSKRPQNHAFITSGSSSMAAGSSSGSIPQEFIEEIKHAFRKFDANNDGQISAEELRCILRSLGDNTTQEEAELMVAEVDADQDGFIDLQEFIDLNTRVGGNGSHSGSIEVASDELAAAFDMFDLDKNGCITPDELHHVLLNLGNDTSTLDDCKRMICGVDRKGSGHVDFDDFKIMMTSTSTTMAAVI